VHAWDRSYWQLYLTWRGLNVSVEWAGSNAGAGASAHQELSLIITVVSGNATDFDLLVTGSFEFDLGGSVTSSTPTTTSSLSSSSSPSHATASAAHTDTTKTTVPSTLTLLPAGKLRNVTLSVFDSPSTSTTPLRMFTHGDSVGGANASVRVSLARGSAAASTILSSIDAIRSAVADARTSATAFAVGGRVVPLGMREAGTAMQSCLMWNVIYDPSQTAPFVTVSRSFTFHPCECAHPCMCHASRDGRAGGACACVCASMSAFCGVGVGGCG
jgi:hypothetical protein